MVKKTSGPGSAHERPPALEWVMSHKKPELLPTPWLTDEELEDFTEALLVADRLLGTNVRHVAHVERWGVPGDKQDGIDFFGKFNDDVPAAWQVKQLVKLTAADVRDAVDAVTFDDADEYYLVYGGIAKKQAREEMLKHDGWTLLDRRNLTEMVRLLPAHVQRELIERFWGLDIRRRFVTAPGDAFVSLEVFKSGRLNANSMMNDLGPLAGRETDLGRLADALDRNSDTFRQVVVVSGPSGRGKSRLVVEALAVQQEQDPTMPVICLSAQHTFDAAAMGELRAAPSIVFIDDAHNDPAALAPLLATLRNEPDIQVILATRPSALRAVEERVSLAPFAPGERATIDVGELELADARRLVKGLIEGLDLRFELRNYLADQATHSPHVAVILTSLIRTRQLSGAIAVDANLRELVLARYQELLVPGDVEGFQANTTRRVIATYASLQPVQESDEALQARIAAFCGLTVFELAQIVRALIDRGILVVQQDKLRVVPDLLADRVIEMMAAFEKQDSGFVGELWNEFGADHHHSLAVSLGELDWRLSHNNGPNVMARVWDAIRDRLKTPYCSRLCSELDQLEQLAATQPAALVAVLDELRQRLDEEDAAGVPVPEDPVDRPYRRLLSRMRPRDRNDARAKMPPLYARAAANDPDVLEQALDALWALRKSDARLTNSSPDHADRMVADRLANLATLPDQSFPRRIVARVGLWLDQPNDDDDVATPLFALKPLLAKEGLETVQSSFHALQFRPHLISAKAMRPVRDQIRALLLAQGMTTDLRIAGAALDLLGESLRPPRGYFGQAIGTDAILTWEDDDLASVAVLEQIAGQTPSAAVRNEVRKVVSWNAEHATSLQLQHAAMTLAARLDATDELEDLVADVLSGEWGRLLEPIKHLPTLEQLEVELRAEDERTADFTDEQRQAEQHARIRAKIEARDQYVAARNADLARRLIELGDGDSILVLLDRTAREVQQIRKDKHIILMSLWNEFEQQAPEYLGAFVTGIASSEAGPLDNALDLIIDRWIRTRPDDASAWVQDAVRTGRKEVRLAIAAGFRRAGWQSHAEEVSTVWTQGLTDDDPDVVQAFLRGAGGYLRTNPVEAADVLLRHDISPFGATRVLEDACSYDGRTFGTSLEQEAATALFLLVQRAGLGGYVVQEIMTGIATVQPRLVLDFLAQLGQGDEPLPNDIHELRVAYDQHPETLAAWVGDHLNLDPTTTGLVLDAAVNQHLTESQAVALAHLCENLSGRELIAFVGCLAPLSLWAVHHPGLAETVMQRARQTDVGEQALTAIRNDGVSLRGWGWTNGVSEELNLGRDAVAKAAEETADDELGVEFRAAQVRFQAQIDEISEEHGREEADDW